MPPKWTLLSLVGKKDLLAAYEKLPMVRFEFFGTYFVRNSKFYVNEGAQELNIISQSPFNDLPQKSMTLKSLVLQSERAVEVDAAVIDYIRAYCDMGVMISGSFLMTKADEFAPPLGCNSFRANNEWLARLEEREALAFKKLLHGEGVSQQTSLPVTNEWPQLLQELSSEQIRMECR